MKRAADRRSLDDDLKLLAEHLKRTYALSVRAIHLPKPPCPFSNSTASLYPKVIKVVLDPSTSIDAKNAPPAYLDYYGIEYVVG